MLKSSDPVPQSDQDYATGPGCFCMIDIITVSSQSAQYHTKRHKFLRHPHYVTRMMFGSVLFPVLLVSNSLLSICAACACMLTGDIAESSLSPSVPMRLCAHVVFIMITRAYIEMQKASLRSLDRLECSYMRRKCSPEE